MTSVGETLLYWRAFAPEVTSGTAAHMNTSQVIQVMQSTSTTMSAQYRAWLDAYTARDVRRKLRRARDRAYMCMFAKNMQTSQLRARVRRVVATYGASARI